MSPTMKQTTAMAANAVATPLAGSQYEYLSRRAKVQFAILNDPDVGGAGVSAGQTEASIFTGPDVVMEPSVADDRVATQPIQKVFDIVAEDIVPPGQRISIRLRNLGVASSVRTVVWVTYF